jgi:hypothetical protein
MPKPKICFDQVPLRVVKKILEDQAQSKKTAGQIRGTKSKKSAKTLRRHARPMAA